MKAKPHSPPIMLGPINRKLASRRERIERTAARDRPHLGQYVLLDTRRRNCIIATHVDPAAIAARLGIC